MVGLLQKRLATMVRYLPRLYADERHGLWLPGGGQHLVDACHLDQDPYCYGVGLFAGSCMDGSFSFCHGIAQFARTSHHGGGHQTGPIHQAMLGTLMEQSMLHLLHHLLLVHDVLCCATFAVRDFGQYRRSRLCVFGLGCFFDHVAGLDLSANGDYVSFSRVCFTGCWIILGLV